MQPLSLKIVSTNLPLVLRLYEFNEREQREIFDAHLQGEDFAAFQAVIGRFDLDTLLPNPQFLKLFADAYIESERSFTDKRSIFSQAVERLAKEENKSVNRANGAISRAQKINLSSEVFAKLLLSGAEGISTNEATENRLYPLLASLFKKDVSAHSILATRLFKPGESEDHHRPVHKIVAEYCAANYLIKRIADSTDTLTLSKCLPIIAPKLTVRDELRGLLGWMAALGNKSVEEAVIELDPYAVLANGDPSQLEHSSKRLLVKRLGVIEAKDPYFRRGDLWRKFSVAGFFTSDVVDEIRPLLTTRNDGHLRDLILELLTGSSGINLLKDELRQIALTPYESDNTRILASRCLFGVADHDYRPDIELLVSEGSHTSLNIVAEAIEALDPKKFEQAFLANFLSACARLYPSRREHFDRTIGARYFVKRFIFGLDKETVTWLLNDLTDNLRCNCGRKPFECECRTGTSKVVGSMLDRYFELTNRPYDPKLIWRWVGSLKFHEHKSSDQSKAVQVLQEDLGLRRGIIAHVFGELTDQDKIYETRAYKFNWYCHSGLNLYSDDSKFIVDLAFSTDNTELWKSFIALHQYHRKREERGPDNLRRHMRSQVLNKPSFMKEWVKSNRASAESERKNRLPRFTHTKRMSRRVRKQNDTRLANIMYVQDNRELVESGRHWYCLARFADLILTSPEKIQQEFGSEVIVRNALQNCLDFIAPEVPDLSGLADLRCASKYSQAEHILYAACLETIRSAGNLGNVDIALLRVLRANIDVHYGAVSNEDRKALKVEVDRLIFPDREKVESFLREYLEPQLAHPNCKSPKIWLLHDDEIFREPRTKLSTEWLKRFDELDLMPLDTLFEIAAQHGNRDDLKAIILERCAEFQSNWPKVTDEEVIEQKRTFWFVRAWYFFNDPSETYWSHLKNDKNILLTLCSRSGHMYRSDYSHWPKLTPKKIESVLDAFIEKWLKVDLPSQWGSDSPKEEVAYRFLVELIWSLSSSEPDEAIPVVNRLLDDRRFADFRSDLRSIHANQIRKKSLMDFKPPTPQDIVDRLDYDAVVTVEGLRGVIIQELQNFQKALDGGEYNSAKSFYQKGERHNELRSAEIIAERLSLRLEQQNISITPEHQLKDAKRSDFTATKMIGGVRRLLVVEVKGQWHPQLYVAASTQLHERYSIHPDAEQQGIFLVLWFGANEKVAGRKNHGIESAPDLKRKIEASIPPELAGLIDVFVLDVTMEKSTGGNEG